VWDERGTVGVKRYGASLISTTEDHEPRPEAAHPAPDPSRILCGGIHTHEATNGGSPHLLTVMTMMTVCDAHRAVAGISSQWAGN
jgi:hypothetical protein